MSDQIGKLLERVARQILGKPSHVVAEREFYEGEVTKVAKLLEARLGPLLRAGQAMRDQLDAILAVDDRVVTNGDTLKILDEWQDRSEEIRAALRDYATALEWVAGLAALEGRDGK